MEDTSHIVAGCPQMSARYYLPLRHDEIAKTVLNSHLKKFCPDKQVTLSSDPEYIQRTPTRILVEHFDKNTRVKLAAGSQPPSAAKTIINKL